MSNQEKDIDDDYSRVNIALDAVEEGEGVVDSINPGKGLRKIGFGVVIKMVGGGGRKFKIGKGGLTDAMLSGIKEKNYSNLPKVGTHVKYKYCALNSNNLPTFPALTDDYTVQKNIGSMHVGTGKKNWSALKFKKKMVGL